MLTGINMYNELGSHVLTLPVFNASPSSRYLVKDVKGLDPVKAELSTGTIANLDGVQLMSSRVGARNIVMTIGYNPNYVVGETVASLRRELYEQFPPKGGVRMRFSSDDFETVKIDGFVESHETVLFSRDPEVQISIICPSPYFSALSSATHRGVNSFNYSELKVLGTAPTGFIFKTDPLDADMTNVVLENRLDSRIHIEGSFLLNDVITVSTEPGNKYARRTRTGSTVSILDGLVGGSLSMALDNRTTTFKFSTEQTAAQSIEFSLTYTPKFIGI